MMGFKLKVDYAEVEVCVDSYEHGEGEHVNNFDLPLEDKVYDTMGDLLAAINYCMGAFSTNPADYGYIDGRIDTDALVNVDNYEASEQDIAEWKRGELELYNAHLCCAITMVPTGGEHQLSEEEADAFGISIY